MHRAHRDGVALVATRVPAGMLATNPVTGGAYTLTRRSCTCPAGTNGRPCKQRGLYLFLSAIDQARPTTGEAVAA